MRVLVFGQTGQVARELARILPEGRFLGRPAADLTDPEVCAAAIRSSDAEVVINAAAWTAVDAAEDDETAATVVNGAAPTAMAGAAAAKGLPFLHVSTDYVFEGAGDTPFSPNHPTGPRNAYGRSKLAGELGVRAAGGRHLILRTSWLFSAHGTNFVKTMLRLAEKTVPLRVVADQIGGPTSAASVARALVTAAQALRDGAGGGTHHFAGAPDVSWAGFAREILAISARLREVPVPQVEDIASAAYPARAKRPMNLRLDCNSFETAYGVPRPDWRQDLADVITELHG